MVRPVRILLLFIYFFKDIEPRSPMTSEVIPESLVVCYKNDIPLMPMTIQTFIDIIMKIELNPYVIMDMRVLSNTILHRFWKEGLERDPDLVGNIPSVVTPYSASGFQSYKYELLIDKLLPSVYMELPNDTLTLSEQCTLHFMLSSSVYAWERGDESKTCPELKTEQKQSDPFEEGRHKRSSCPIESGVVMDGCGRTLSPGRVIAGIAAALQPLFVTQQQLVAENYSSYFDKRSLIDNRWAATLAGDLAEIIVIQAPLTQELYLGPSGKWNDTVIPVEYYMTADPDTVARGFWQLTDAELVGSIDGLILAQEAERWVNIIGSLKLSQLLGMYYSDLGGNILSQAKYTNRRQYYLEHLSKQSKSIILQTQYLAQVLALRTPHYFVNISYLEAKSKEAFDAFRDHMSAVFNKDDECQVTIPARPKLKMNIVFDSTWTPYERLRLFMATSSDLDVSTYGGTMSIINGKTGQFVVRNARTAGDLFLQWRNATPYSRDPVGLDLTRSLLAIKADIENSTSTDDSTEPCGRVTVILGLSAQLTDRDTELSATLLKSIKALLPEMLFIYVTSSVNAHHFVRLTGFMNTWNDEVIALSTNSLYRVREKLMDTLADVPRILRPATCINDTEHLGEPIATYEEYINPGIIYNYKIPSQYICYSTPYLKLQIKNSGYGTVSVCMTRDQMTSMVHQECKDLPLYSETSFVIKKPCNVYDKDLVIKTPMGLSCKDVYLMVKGRRSLNMCTENSCRTPDQIRFAILVSGLNCIKDNYVRCSAPTYMKTFKHNDLSLIVLILFSHMFCYTMFSKP